MSLSLQLRFWADKLDGGNTFVVWNKTNRKGTCGMCQELFEPKAELVHINVIIHRHCIGQFFKDAHEVLKEKGYVS